MTMSYVIEHFHLDGQIHFIAKFLTVPPNIILRLLVNSGYNLPIFINKPGTPYFFQAF